MQAGDWFAERFRLEAVLGRGSTGEVWNARDESGARYVIKRLRRSADLEQRRRFARELDVARRLGPPHFPALLDGVASDEGPCFIVWREIPGELLVDWAERTAPDIAGRAKIVLEILDALRDLHAAGIVHRDLKPEHVLVTASGSVCLLDLGICRAVDGDRLTASRHLLGSAPYTAPEQISASHSVDVRADLYAVGAIAFWLLSGRLPFWAPTGEALLSLKLLRNAPRLWDISEIDVPDALDEWVASMLERDPAGRPANAEAAAVLLERALSSPE